MKHEKVLILLLAYIIGFITAYIAFGVNNITAITDSDDQTITTVNSKMFKPERTHHYLNVSAEVIDNSLYAILDNRKRILSVMSHDEFGRPGYHNEIVTYLTSENGDYIFYCTKIDENSFNSYIYDVAADYVYMINQEKLGALGLNEMKSVKWSKDNRLIIGDFESESSDTPWQLRAK